MSRGAWTGPLGLFRPGTSLVHRAAPGVKLAFLAALGVVVVVLRGPVAALATAAVVLAVAVWARLSGRATLRALTPVLVLAAVLGAYQWWQRGASTAIEVSVDLVTLVLGATVVTATTASDQLLATFVAAVRPLRRLGADPEAVGLAATLMLRSIPAIIEVLGQTRDAARARGLERNPRALLVPAVLRIVGRAQTTGQALAARGLGD